MSLLNKAANVQPSTIIIKEVVRNRRTESFGDSVFNDAAEAAVPAAHIVNSVYRNKAFKAIQKRNRILQNESEYVNMLANLNVGDNFSIYGNMSESNFFDYICKYCKMEIMVHERNTKLGNVSPAIEAKLQNPPHPSQGHFSKVAYCNSIMMMCKKDLLKAGFSKVSSLVNEKED